MAGGANLDANLEPSSRSRVPIGTDFGPWRGSGGALRVGSSLAIATAATALIDAHLVTIRIPEEAPEPHADAPRFIDFGGAIRAVKIVPGLLALLFFSTFNNFLGGVFMALLDPYGLSLMSVETYGIVVAITSSAFIVGGILVARRGLGRNPSP